MAGEQGSWLEVVKIKKKGNETHKRCCFDRNLYVPGI